MLIFTVKREQIDELGREVEAFKIGFLLRQVREKKSFTQ
jgi:hypothetical protein